MSRPTGSAALAACAAKAALGYRAIERKQVWHEASPEGVVQQVCSAGFELPDTLAP
jgi:hypothetical protein